MKHLVVDISAHGFGHVAQTTAVLNALQQRLPSLRITVRTGAPLSLLRQRLRGEFTHLPLSLDFGMVMENAVSIRVAESRARYHEFHANWAEKVAREAAALQALAPDLLLANVPYLSLAAAQQAGVPAVALCSLNWAEIYQHYCLQDDTDQRVLSQMLDAYRSAHGFLQPQPSMAMPALLNARAISPLANVGQAQPRAAEFAAEKWVLVAMGGVELRLPIEQWAAISGVRWIIPAAWKIERADCRSIESFDCPFSDLLASCDAVLTKPGYGMFTEAACTGVPLLYVARRDWPEEPYLVDWLRQNGRLLEVSHAQLLRGDLALALQDLWAMPRPTPPLPSGAEEAANYLADLLMPA